MCWNDLPAGTTCDGERYHSYIRVVAELINRDYTVVGGYAAVDTSEGDML
jgi:hypothetical protein